MELNMNDPRETSEPKEEKASNKAQLINIETESNGSFIFIKR
jgi:hypothetical protein